MDLSNKEENKKTRRRGYESLLLLLLIISLFVTATYAWFTDTAYSTGNTVFSGNMNVQIIVSEDDMIEFCLANYKDEIDEILSSKYNNKAENNCYAVYEFATASDDPLTTDKVEGLGLETYTRAYPKELGSSEYIKDMYYIVTNKELALINIYNMEPGQARKVTVSYLNIGDLAFKTSGSLKFDEEKSYTGLETLNQQFGGTSLTYKNNYSVIHGTIMENNKPVAVNYVDPELILNGVDEEGVDRTYYSLSNDFVGNSVYTDPYENYSRIFDKLIKLQAVETTDTSDEGKVKKYVNEAPVGGETTVTYDSVDYVEHAYKSSSEKYYTDEGGKLEEVLQVFVGVDSNTPHDIFREKDPNYFFGSLQQFQYLINNGAEANKDYELTDADGNGDIDIADAEQLKDSSNEAYYMTLFGDINKSLYNDFQKYLNNASGRCLPKDSVRDGSKSGPEQYGPNASCQRDVAYLDANEFKVTIYQKPIDPENVNDSNNPYFKAGEIGSTEFYLYMPEDADSKYQNASITLSLGVTATQTENEMDDTQNMIYDRNDINVDPVETSISFMLDYTGYKDNINYDPYMINMFKNFIADEDFTNDLNTLNYNGYLLKYENSDIGKIDHDGLIIKDSINENDMLETYRNNILNKTNLLICQFNNYQVYNVLNNVQNLLFTDNLDKLIPHIYYGAFNTISKNDQYNYYIGVEAEAYAQKIVDHLNRIQDKIDSPKTIGFIYNHENQLQSQIFSILIKEGLIPLRDIGKIYFDPNSIESIVWDKDSTKLDVFAKKYDIIINLDNEEFNDIINLGDPNYATTSFVSVNYSPYSWPYEEMNVPRRTADVSNCKNLDTNIYLNPDIFYDNVLDIITNIASSNPANSINHKMLYGVEGLCYSDNFTLD